MKWIISQFLVMTFFQAIAFGETVNPPIVPPQGLFVHKGKLVPRTVKMTKLFYQADTEDKQTIDALKQEGYNCVSRSTTQAICFIQKAITELPSAASKKTIEMLKDLTIQFPTEFQIELYQNEPNIQVWVVNGSTQIGDKKENGYLIKKINNSAITLQIPDADGNPISNLNCYDHQEFGYPMVLRASDDNGWSYFYRLDAIYESNESISK